MQTVQSPPHIQRLLTLIALTIVLLPLAACKSRVSDKKIDFIELTPAVEYFENAQSEPTNALFIDARNHERFAAGHIRGARNIRVNEIDLRYDPDPELLKYDNLIVYGENPGSAAARAVAKRLIEAGYNTFFQRRVRLFLGGWVVWESSGLPVGTIEPEPMDTTDTPEGTPQG